MASASPLLLIDFDAGGHHHLHIIHYIRFALKNNLDNLKFLLSRELVDCVMPVLTSQEASYFMARVLAVEDDPMWARFRKWTQSITLTRILYVEYLNLHNRGQRNLLYLHLETVLYQLALAPIPRANTSGLMFRPTFHYRQRKMLDAGLRNRMIFILKWMTAYALKSRSGFTQVFLLDELAEDYALSHWRSGKFKWAPDPVGPAPGALRPVGSAKPVSGRPLVLLLAGALHPRKGLSLIADALALSPEVTRRGVLLSIVGKPMKGFADYVTSNIERLRTMGVHVDADLKFVTDEALDQALMASDIVLTPYQGFKGSSGLLILAAHFGKPVISTNEGLLGYLVDRHSLGEAVEVSSAIGFSKCLDDLVARGRSERFDPVAARKFADTFNPEEFAALLLNYVETSVAA